MTEERPLKRLNESYTPIVPKLYQNSFSPNEGGENSDSQDVSIEELDKHITYLQGED